MWKQNVVKEEEKQPRIMDVMVAYLQKALEKGDLSEKVLELTSGWVFSCYAMENLYKRSHPGFVLIGWFSGCTTKYFELWLLGNYIVKKTSNQPKTKPAASLLTSWSVKNT